jgi:CubicO group peptidase (beta-lactamase class C family)
MKSEKTPHNRLEKEIKKLLEKGVLEGVFPAAAAGISCGLGREKKEIISFYGRASHFPEKRLLKKRYFFDLASLTKPFATTMAVLSLIKEKKIDLDETLPSLLERKIKDEKNKIKTRHLLSHCSGLPAHREYFKNLKDIPSKEKNKFIENIILQEKLENSPGKKAIYSDLGFMLLGCIIEKKAGCNLAQYVSEKIMEPLRLEKKIFYNHLLQGRQKTKRVDFVATENCPWRKKILCGEVHDDNCYTLDGVAGHSGLFGNIEGVTAYTGLILEMWKGQTKHPNIKKEDLENFLTRQEDVPGSSWALGFDTPAEKESSCGSYFSQKSIGHLGFTGTSFWLDPEKNVGIVLLTNRVHPSRQNPKIKQFRPFFHDRVMEKLFSLST